MMACRTARVWKEMECVAVLKGHEQAVWGVKLLSDGRILTGIVDPFYRTFYRGSFRGQDAGFMAWIDSIKSVSGPC